MIPKDIEAKITSYAEQGGRIHTRPISDAAKYGYSLAQQSIQDEAIAFAKWIQNKGYFASTTVSNLWISKDYLDFTTEQLYTKFKTEQYEQK